MSKLEMVDGFWPVGTVVRLLGDASPSMVATSECRIEKADGRPPVLYTYVANEKREQVFCWLEFTPAGCGGGPSGQAIAGWVESRDQWRKREVWLDPRLTEPV